MSEEQILPAGGWGEQASRPCSCWAQGKGWLGSWQLAERTWSALLCLQPLPLGSLIDDPRRPGLLMGQQPHLRGSCQVNLPALPPFLLRLPAPHPRLLKCCDIAPSSGSHTLCPPFPGLCDPGAEHSCAGQALPKSRPAAVFWLVLYSVRTGHRVEVRGSSCFSPFLSPVVTAVWGLCHPSA